MQAKLMVKLLVNVICFYLCKYFTHFLREVLKVEGQSVTSHPETEISHRHRACGLLSVATRG